MRPGSVGPAGSASRSRARRSVTAGPKSSVTVPSRGWTWSLIQLHTTPDIFRCSASALRMFESVTRNVTRPLPGATRASLKVSILPFQAKGSRQRPPTGVPTRALTRVVSRSKPVSVPDTLASLRVS